MTNILLVIHAEALGTDESVKALKSLGKELEDHIRPILACVTPFAPQYRVPPLLDTNHEKILASTIFDSDVRRFSETISTLSRWFDIGYHGHFHIANGEPGMMEPCSDPWRFTRQFNAEVSLLSELGFRPKVYAGGWWLMTAQLAHMLSMASFEADTTVNDLKRDDFGGLQYGRDIEFGRPDALFRDVMEMQTLKSISRSSNIPQGARKFYCLHIRDLDLLDRSRKTRRRVDLTVAGALKSSSLGFDEIRSKALVVA